MRAAAAAAAASAMLVLASVGLSSPARASHRPCSAFKARNGTSDQRQQLLGVL